MKKYILGLTIAASTLSLAGCSDFLDTPVLGQQDLSEYFVNEDLHKQPDLHQYYQPTYHLYTYHRTNKISYVLINILIW